MMAKKWLGSARHQPEQPDIVVARHLRWTMASRHNWATVSYPEPCNLTAAAAWSQIPRDMIAREAIIYRDGPSGLWIQAVAYRLIPPDLAGAWCDLQSSMGAVATWRAVNPQPARHQPTLVEAEINSRSHDDVTLTHVLDQLDKFMIGDKNIKLIMPDSFGDMTRGYIKQTWVKPQRAPGQVKCSKCILTPQGVFVSARAASDALGIKYNQVALRAQRCQDGFRYITTEEYLAHKKINNTDTA